MGGRGFPLDRGIHAWHWGHMAFAWHSGQNSFDLCRAIAGTTVGRLATIHLREIARLLGQKTSRRRCPMKLLKTLFITVVGFGVMAGLGAAAAYAEQVKITLQSAPFTVWEFGRRDSG